MSSSSVTSSILGLSGYSKVKYVQFIHTDSLYSAVKIRFGIGGELPAGEDNAWFSHFSLSVCGAQSSGNDSDEENLFQAAERIAEAAFERKLFMSCQEGRDLAALMSARLGVEVQAITQKNGEGARIRQERRDQLFESRRAPYLEKIFADAEAAFDKGEPMAFDELIHRIALIPVEPIKEVPEEDLPEDERFVVAALEMRAIEGFKDAVAILKEHGYVRKTEVESIEQFPLIRKLSAFQAEKQKLTSHPSCETKGILKSHFRPFVQLIALQCAQLCYTVNYREVAFAALMGSALDLGTVRFEPFRVLLKISYEDCSQLNDIYFGRTNREQMLRELGFAVPDLVVQRAALFEVFEEVLLEIFGEEPSPQLPLGYSLELTREIRKQLFAMGYNHVWFQEKSFEVLINSPDPKLDSYMGTLKALEGDYPEEWFDWISGKVLTREEIHIRIEGVIDAARARVQAL